MGDAPKDFKPMRMNCVTNYDYLISNGKLYVRNIQASYDALYQDGLFPNFPYPGDYELIIWEFGETCFLVMILSVLIRKLQVICWCEPEK